MNLRISWIALAPVALASPAWATTYLSVAEAQAALFPDQALKPAPIELTPAQVAEIHKASGVQPLSRSVKAWRAPDGGWFIVDEVVGKHEFITYAVALDRAGAVHGLEIMDYKETYGGQVRDPRWRAQFTGRKVGDPLRLGPDIHNVSGATLSCKHVTDGVHRLLETWRVALAQA